MNLLIRLGPQLVFAAMLLYLGVIFIDGNCVQRLSDTPYMFGHILGFLFLLLHFLLNLLVVSLVLFKLVNDSFHEIVLLILESPNFFLLLLKGNQSLISKFL